MFTGPFRPTFDTRAGLAALVFAIRIRITPDIAQPLHDGPGVDRYLRGLFLGVFGMSARQLCAITKNDNCRNGELARQGMEEGLGKVSCNSDPGTAYPMIPCRLHILQVSLKLEPKVEGGFLIQKD